MLAYVYVKHGAGEVEVQLFFGKRDKAEHALLNDALELLNEDASANLYEFNGSDTPGILADAYGPRGIKFNPGFDENRETVTMWLRDFELEVDANIEISCA